MDHRVQVCMHRHIGSRYCALSAVSRLWQEDHGASKAAPSSKRHCAGKTTAVVEAVLQEVKRGNRVLACAASNIAASSSHCYLECSLSTAALPTS